MPPTPSQLARAIEPVIRQCTRGEVWGAPLFATRDVIYEVESVSGLFAGLKLCLRPASGGDRRVLKIAQPGGVTVETGRLQIVHARYISWGRVKFKPARGEAKPALVLS